MPKISDISINDRFVKALEVPTNAPHKIYWDGKTTGFGVRITQSGAVSFVLRYVLNGRERKYTIGAYPTHSALSARETAIKLKGKIAKGFDPQEKKKAIRDDSSFAEMCYEYIEKHAKIHKKTWQYFK